MEEGEVAEEGELPMTSTQAAKRHRMHGPPKTLQPYRLPCNDFSLCVLACTWYRLIYRLMGFCCFTFLKMHFDGAVADYFRILICVTFEGGSKDADRQESTVSILTSVIIVLCIVQG